MPFDDDGGDKQPPFSFSTTTPPPTDPHPNDAAVVPLLFLPHPSPVDNDVSSAPLPAKEVGQDSIPVKGRAKGEGVAKLEPSDCHWMPLHTSFHPPEKRQNRKNKNR